MQITDIKIRKLFNEGPMKAVASVTFDGQLAVHDIKVINAREKLFIVMPSRKNPDDTYRDIVHPINSHFRATLEAAVIAAYEDALENAESFDDVVTAEVDINVNTEPQNCGSFLFYSSRLPCDKSTLPDESVDIVPKLCSLFPSAPGFIT